MADSKRRALRWILYLGAAVVVAVALLVGSLRLLLPLVPDYREDIRAWASAATGYDIRFDGLSASWPIAGPELTFYGASLTRPGDAGPFVAAREFSAGVSLLTLLRERRPTIGHVVVRGMELRVERLAAGDWRVQGRRLDELLPPRRAEQPPRLRLVLEDVRVDYVDTERAPGAVALQLDRLTARIDRDSLAATARLRPPPEFGRGLELQVSVPLPLGGPARLPPDWSARAAGTDVDLPRVLGFLATSPGRLDAARGDVSIEARFSEGRPEFLAAGFGLGDVRIGGEPGPSAYERLAGRVAWTRIAAGWEASLSDLRVRRDGRDSPPGNAALRYEPGDEVSAGRWSGNARFLRLEDLLPLVRGALAGTEIEARLPRVLRGDVRDAVAEIAVSAEEPARYSLRVGFERLGAVTADGEIDVDGLTGRITADGDGGRLELDSRDAALDLTQWFRNRLEVQALQGLVVWRTGPTGLRLLSDDIVMKAAAIDIRSRLELDFPADGSSPAIDLKATASATEARQVLRFLPLRRFPPQVVEWLERAVVGGQVPRATVDFRGPLRAFPFEGDEGVFRVVLGLENGTLDYANGWPRVEDLDAEVVFDGVGMYSTRNRARIGNLAVRDYTVRIRDLREGVLALSGSQRAGLDDVFGFVRATPIARRLGPTLARVTSAGPVDTALRLALPIRRLSEYRLDVLFDARGCRLGLQRLPVDLKNLRGRVRLENTRFSAEGLSAVLLGEPVRVDLRPEAEDSPVSHTAVFASETPVARVTSTFGLPLREYFEGRLGWTAEVRVPALRERGGLPLRLELRSDLVGVTSTLPEPLRKQASTAWPAETELSFPEGDVIDVIGRLEPPFAWALRLAAEKSGGWRVERGALLAGPGEARLPARSGVELSGRVATVRLDDWLDLGGGDGRALRETYREAALDIGMVTVAGQVFRDVGASARRAAQGWNVAVRSPNAEGQIFVPFDTARVPLRLDMKRLWLIEPEPATADAAAADPRDAVGMEIRAEDAALGDWRVGALDMSIERAPDGLVARRIQTRAPSFQVDADGSWRVEGNDPSRQYTRVQATLQGNDIRDTLERLGFDPVISGEQVKVGASLVWPGGPGADFRSTASGRMNIELARGQVLNLEPGGGRILGLLSVTALPRRLALDFSDVFQEGLGFDAIRGDFRVDSGNVYTCNLGLTGPGADIGIVGRTGLGQRDYDQVAVVRPQVSSMLAVGGAVLGGPVGGVTMLLISQIFRKPLSTLGESYYRVSGGWDEPAVVRVQRSEVDAAAFKDCERELAAALDAAVPAGATNDQAPQEPR